MSVINQVELDPISKEEFENLMGKKGDIVICEFWNSGCVVCPQQHQILQILEEQYHSNGFSKKFKLKIYLFNIDKEKNRKLALEKLGVQILPTVVVLKNGKFFQFNGLTQFEELKYFFNQEKSLCINCSQYNPEKKNKYRNGYCQKYGIYPEMRDSCK
jgi:thioredoxin-like negative regulator of GroEL